MATHDSALKRARQSQKKRERNTAVKSLLKTHSKKVLKAVEEKNPQKAKDVLHSAIPALQKASGKGIIHKRTAARRISRLTKKVNVISSPSATSAGTPSR